MSQVLPLKRGVIYGPVNSRRLGRSLGINLSPTKTKLCPFDCLYCHYGHTRIHTADTEQYRDYFPAVAEVAAALRHTLDSRVDPAYVTFSGNGEPAIHPDFPLVVEEVKMIVRALAPQARLAILSNSVMAAHPAVAGALAALDVRIMKLDAGNEATFVRLNRPAPGITLEKIVEGLTHLREVTIQTLFAGGSCDNSADADVVDWLDCLKKIRPVAVQIYTCDRHPADERLQKVPRERLAEIAATATEQLGVPVEAY